MKEKIIKIIKEKQKEYEFNSSPYNALRQVEERIKGLTQPSEKPTIDEKFCPYCGIEKEHIIPSDANSGRVCRYSLCRGGVIRSQEKPSATIIKSIEDEITITSTGKLGSDPNPNSSLKVGKPSAEEWLDQEFGDAYIEHDGWGDIKFLSIGKVIEALNQYAKQ
jgi:hypothetical protein